MISDVMLQNFIISAKYVIIIKIIAVPNLFFFNFKIIINLLV